MIRLCGFPIHFGVFLCIGHAWNPEYNVNCGHDNNETQTTNGKSAGGRKVKYSMGYEVSLVEKKIVMTKDFARKAAILGTEEYARYMQLKAQYPTFTPTRYSIDQKADRVSYAKLSYKSMAILIAEWRPNDKAALEELESVKREAKAYAGSYGIIKHWFLSNYKEQYMSRMSASTNDD